MTDGLMYSGYKDGAFRMGWLCRSDNPSYQDPQAWKDALEEILKTGINLRIVRRCTLEEFQTLFPAASIMRHK